jgi:alpha/beta superfamily hydrolase
MNAKTEILLISGPTGHLELAIDRPEGPADGIAIIAHPHPLFGGTKDNKVVQTIARAMLSRGMVCVRPSFRGVGGSEGVHDHGQGEKDDLWAAWHWAEQGLGAQVGQKRWQAGFSFGAVISSHLAVDWHGRRSAMGLAPLALSACLLVGLATERMSPAPPVPGVTRMIHGEADDVASLSGALDYARPHHQPILVLPGAGHFFHGLLIELREMILTSLSNA